MAVMPDVVTHRYDPAVGACLNICVLEDSEASRVLDSLRRGSRPRLSPGYLARRRSTELWLARAASEALTRCADETPAYSFLGDFSYGFERSRPASLVVPLPTLPSGAITFTLGDSMSVAEQTGRRVYTLDEMAALFGSSSGVVEGFGLSDRNGFQEQFIEVQLWDRSHPPLVQLMQGENVGAGLLSSNSPNLAPPRRRMTVSQILSISKARKGRRTMKTER